VEPTEFFSPSTALEKKKRDDMHVGSQVATVETALALSKTPVLLEFSPERKSPLSADPAAPATDSASADPISSISEAVPPPLSGLRSSNPSAQQPPSPPQPLLLHAHLEEPVEEKCPVETTEGLSEERTTAFSSKGVPTQPSTPTTSTAEDKEVGTEVHKDVEVLTRDTLSGVLDDICTSSTLPIRQQQVWKLHFPDSACVRACC
jgi:hypothetical protein